MFFFNIPYIFLNFQNYTYKFLLDSIFKKYPFLKKYTFNHPFLIRIPALYSDLVTVYY